MKIGLIGARRARNGIGEFIGRYLYRNDARVVCVLGTTGHTASQACEALKGHGISARPYRDFHEMVSSESLDAIAIASPASTHYAYLLEAIDRGLSVFCEKPFLDPAESDVDGRLETVFTRASAAQVTIAMNSQWPFCLPFYEELCGSIRAQDVRSFSMRLSPIVSGPDMIPDSVPHALSMLYAAIGGGSIRDLSIDRGEGTMEIRFIYAAEKCVCETSISLVQEATQPRTFSFGFNGLEARRLIDMATYGISLCHGGKEIRIVDPLDLSVRDFVESVSEGRRPLIGPDHIRATTLLLKQVYDACIRFERV